MIYLDNSATTKPSISAINKASIFNTKHYFNPSTLYHEGLNCAKEIKNAKEAILNSLKTTSHEVIFTSSGTESDNMAVFCAVKRGVFVTSLGEHSAIYKSFLELKNRKLEVYFIDLEKDGSVNTDKLYELALNTKIDFLSLVHVNNETGAKNDVTKIAKRIKSINPSTIIHCDGVQAYGKIPFRLPQEIDLYSISAHKINGLKGTGALIKRKGLNISPLIFGGGQENGLRSGTENLFGIKVFEYALNEKFNNIENTYTLVKDTKEYFINNLDKSIFTIISGENSSPYILSVSAKGIRGEVLMHAIEKEGVIVGNGSACSSKNRYSRVIQACGYDNDVLDGVIRISFCTPLTNEEREKAVNVINEQANNLKGIML